MANEEKDFWSKVIGIGGLGILIYVGYEVLKSVFAFRSEAQIYRCGNCQNVVPYHGPSCPFCNSNLQWPNPGLPGVEPFVGTSIALRVFSTLFWFTMLLTIAFIVMLLVPETEKATSALKELLLVFWSVLFGEWIGMKNAIPNIPRPPRKKEGPIKTAQKTKDAENK